MMKATSTLLTALFLMSSIALLGCTKTIHRGTTINTKQHGPPPHAPAHGYRHKHPHGVVLVYESSIGMYVVSGHRDVYFQKDRYYRLRGNTWHRSVHINGPWDTVAVKKLPNGLQKKWLAKGQAKGKKKNKGPKKK